jgi:hypothetical protein
MAEPTSDKHYEEKFEFPLWKLIKQRAQEKDISYSAAYREVLPEYEKTIRYHDTEWTDEQIRKRNRELVELRERESKKKAAGG